MRRIKLLAVAAGAAATLPLPAVAGADVFPQGGHPATSGYGEGKGAQVLHCNNTLDGASSVAVVNKNGVEGGCPDSIGD